MRYSPLALTWLLRVYPPFLFQGIWVKKISPGFKGAEVKIYKTLFNINTNKTLFGGTIFAAADPIFPILLDQYLQMTGFKKTVAWLKSSTIEFKKPGKTSLSYKVELPDQLLSECTEAIRSRGKIVKNFSLEIKDRYDELCAVVRCETYIRDLNFTFPPRNREAGQ
ncbi:DUF4442 domain-containing protein [Sphingobacterium thalpophilum]|uniref:DUF4442 domain-containing protein n=1 Tax=Sphingobacterium thalpophilum TaxID=259 RepID=A0A4U9VWI2_9SPHI|nr:DUF4442 domain-containing protein [Sphingobacterium thalpophilum]VTR50449.1 Uncharacterised protein [Sphingobacterium thalpophilum]